MNTTLYTTTEKRNYTTLKNAGKLYLLEKAVIDADAMIKTIEGDNAAPEWALPKAEDGLATAKARLAEFREKTGLGEFSDYSESEKTVIMLSLGLKVEKYEDIVGLIVTAKNGEDLKKAAKELSELEGRKVRAYELKDKKGNRVPLIDVWEGMLYSGLKVKKTGLAPTLRKDESYRKEARKYVAFCILG